MIDCVQILKVEFLKINEKIVYQVWQRGSKDEGDGGRLKLFENKSLIN